MDRGAVVVDPARLDRIATGGEYLDSQAVRWSLCRSSKNRANKSRSAVRPDAAA